MAKKILITILLIFLASSSGYADIKLKVAVVNPSDTSKQTTPVRYDLPKGITAEDVIDIGNMELKYDFDSDNYYVYQKLTLKPAEKRILEVRLKDIWIIPLEEINFYKTHTDGLTGDLRLSKHADIGGDLAKSITKRLDEIIKTQKQSALSARDKINTYYENIVILEEIKEDIGMLENLVIDIGGVVEERVAVPVTLAVSLREEEEGEFTPDEIVEIKVKVNNPSRRRKQKVTIKYGLPTEITPRYIIDSNGLLMEYDFDRGAFYLFKDSVELDPSEVKIFNVQVRDIWRIPKVELEAVRSHVDNLMLLIEGTEFFEKGKPLSDRITFNLDEIVRYQTMDVPVDEHIAYYRNNVLLMDETNKYVSQLEKVVSQSGSSPGVTIVKMERLEGGGIEIQRETGYEGMRLVAESIFRGKAPSETTTWKIIFVILAFVGITAGSFFMFWYTQVSKKEKKGM